MPLIGIHPVSDAVEDELAKVMTDIRSQVKEVVMGISGFPEHDVIVTLHRCTVRDADPHGSEIMVFLDTNPNEELEAVANKLRNAVAKVLIDLGLTKDRNVEVWPRFLPGSWCLVTNGEIVDSVDHG